MLKLIGTLRNGSSRLGPRSSSWVKSIPNHQMISACSSTATASQTKVDKPSMTKSEASLKGRDKSKSAMVNLAFDALENDAKSDKNAGVKNSKDINELLNISNSKPISYEHAVLTVSTLCQWVEQGRINLTDFEQDPRYQKLCRILTRTSKTKGHSYRVPEDGKKSPTPATICGLDDVNEYTNVRHISVAQTVKVMSGLAVKQRRVKPLLRVLSGNINRSTTPLNIKQIGDVLYSMATLSFPDKSLLTKLCDDLQKSISTVNQSSVIGSILTSLGMLRYRDTSLMNELSEWTVKHKEILRTQDLCALLMTLATIGYNPANSDVLFKELVVSLKTTDMIKSSQWLDVVWALTVLNQALPEHIESVLNDKFISQLADSKEIPVVKKLKLLNVNAAAKLLMKNYSGPFLKDNSSVLDAPIVKTKDKQAFVKAITDALANLFPSRDHFRVNVDIGTGFLLDVEFFMNKKCAPVPVAKITDDTNAVRVAVVANYYHDYCIGENNLLGSVLLHYRLLEAKKCRVLDISHTDFHTDDKLLERIIYINNRIKSIVK